MIRVMLLKALFSLCCRAGRWVGKARGRKEAVAGMQESGGGPGTGTWG